MRADVDPYAAILAAAGKPSQRLGERPAVDLAR
jgi:hypothetical protein